MSGRAVAELALLKAAAKFAFYAEQHAAKGTPEADAKAEVNRGMFADMRAALLAISRPVTVFGFEGCGWCASVKQYLTQAGIPFAWIEMPEPAERARFYALLGLEDGKGSMPQVFVNGVRIGGFFDTLRLGAQEIAMRAGGA